MSLFFVYICLVLSCIFALLYIPYINKEISKVRSFLKTAPLFFLSLGALFTTLKAPTTFMLLLPLALGFSALGDFFLSRKKEDWFLFGLGAFLLGHVFYILLFAQSSTDFLAEENKLPQLVALFTYGASFGVYMVVKSGKYRWPVLAYMIVLCAMGYFALHLNIVFVSSLWGAFCFILSDSILALRMFVVKEERIKKRLSILVWLSYFPAQILIVLGFLSLI